MVIDEPTNAGLKITRQVVVFQHAHDLITSPAYIVMKAADEFKDKTTAPNQLCQTDFTCLKVTGWGWFYLSTILDDFSRYIIAWKLCPTMRGQDVTDTLDLALAASGCDQARIVHKPRLLSDYAGSPEFASVRRTGRWDCSTRRMISSFSEAGYLIHRLPHPRSCFF